MRTCPFLKLREKDIHHEYSDAIPEFTVDIVTRQVGTVFHGLTCRHSTYNDHVRKAGGSDRALQTTA